MAADPKASVSEASSETGKEHAREEAPEYEECGSVWQFGLPQCICPGHWAGGVDINIVEDSALTIRFIGQSRKKLTKSIMINNDEFESSTSFWCENVLKAANDRLSSLLKTPMDERTIDISSLSIKSQIEWDDFKSWPIDFDFCITHLPQSSSHMMMALSSDHDTTSPMVAFNLMTHGMLFFDALSKDPFSQNGQKWPMIGVFESCNIEETTTMDDDESDDRIRMAGMNEFAFADAHFHLEMTGSYHIGSDMAKIRIKEMNEPSLMTIVTLDLESKHCWVTMMLLLPDELHMIAKQMVEHRRVSVYSTDRDEMGNDRLTSFIRDLIGMMVPNKLISQRMVDFVLKNQFSTLKSGASVTAVAAAAAGVTTTELARSDPTMAESTTDTGMKKADEQTEELESSAADDGFVMIEKIIDDGKGE